MANEYICITQGSAGALEEGESSIGFYTEKVQTCRVSVFECEKATLMVHDSGQIRIQDLSDFITSYGEVMSVQYAVGEETKEPLHSTRFKDLAKSVKFRAADATHIRIPRRIFAVAYSKDIGLVEANPLHFNLRRDLNETVCEAVNVLNDWYTPSQTIPLNVQFKEGKFTPPPSPTLTVSQMLRDLRADKKHGLLGASALGYYGPRASLEIPPELLTFLRKFDLSNACFDGLPPRLKERGSAYQQSAAEFAKLPIFG